MLEKKFYAESTKYNTYEEHFTAPIFRKSFDVKDFPENAELEISALGFYELFVNGRKITKGLIAPYVSNPDHMVYYDKYDITPYLIKGENVIGVALGNGMQNSVGGAMWFFDKAEFRSAPKFALELKMGSTVITASDFVCTESALLFDDLRCGGVYDATKEHNGWNMPGYEQKGWRNVIPAETPRGTLKKCEAEPIKVRRELEPIAINAGEMRPYHISRNDYEKLARTDFEYSDWEETGGYIYDFGVNTSGIVRLKITGKPGQKISIVFGEMLDDDGRLFMDNLAFYPKGYVQRLIYICKGGEEIFEPSFTFYGFRFCYVTGITEEQATPEFITYLEAGSALETRGNFNCSDEVLNKLYEMADRSDRSNFYYFPTDCPHREKNGWTGDIAASAEHMMLHLGAEKSFREYMHSVRKAQNDEGALPGIIPTCGWGFDWGNGPAWDRVLFTLPYIVYKYRGDTDIIKENAHAMMRYLEYISCQRNDKGILDLGMNDWAQIGGGDFRVPLGLLSSVITMEMCTQAMTMFGVVGMTLNRAYAETLYNELKTAVRREYINPETMIAEGNSQASQALCIYYGVFDEEEKPEAFAQLIKILEKDKFELNTGFIAGRVIFHVLAEEGRADAAYQMITSRKPSGYGYLIDIGETTLRETFIKSRYGASHNHHMWGDIINWFTRHIAGIHVNPNEDDPNYIEVRPKFIEDVKNAEAWYDAPGGKISVSWTREREEVLLNVECTCDVMCRVYLGEFTGTDAEDGMIVKKGKKVFHRVILK